MNRILTSIAITGLVLAGAQAFAAGDSMSQAPMTHKQMMKDCMTKQMASDSGMSHKDAMKACKEKMKMRKDSMGTENSTPDQH